MPNCSKAVRSPIPPSLTRKWYTLVVETVGDTLRVALDSQPAALLQSSGIARATNFKIELGVAGKDGFC